jgi:hypothetical protein
VTYGAPEDLESIVTAGELPRLARFVPRMNPAPPPK